MNLEQLIIQVLEEENVSGGAGSAFGSGVGAEGATQFSGDTYNPKSAIIAKPIGKGIIRRSMPTDSIFSGKGKKKRKKK